jgi:predicted RNA binding protein YcfA (HicA-like mRNA interferase family)
VPKLLSSDEIVKILLANGFEFVSQRGSHQKYRNSSGYTVIVPAGRKQTPRGTTQSIIRQSGLDRNLFN